MNERERIAKILTRPVTQAERHWQPSNAQTDVDNTIRIKEALLELAQSVEYLKQATRTEQYLADRRILENDAK